MNINHISVSSSSKAVITPADPTATGTYNLGLSAKPANLTIDQLYTMIATEVDDVAVDLLTGVAVVSGGQHAGGAGLDVDGQTIALTELGVIHLRNTGSTDIALSIPALDGAVNVITSITVRPNGEFYYNSQASVADAEMRVEALVGGEQISLELCVMGKQ